MKKIAIIGSGLSGLSAAHLLQGQAEVTLFEKSRGVSGRLSTRRAKTYFFDHGAQYFTARTPAFQDFLRPLIAAGVIKRWDARYVQFDQDRIVKRQDWQDDEPRYVGIPSMNRIGQFLAKGLEIHLNTHITTLHQADRWQLTDQDGHTFGDFDGVITAIPAPQANALMPDNFTHHRAITTVKMQACFALMLGFAQPITLAFDAAHVMNADISWIAHNSRKPARDRQHSSLVVHSSPAYAETHLDAPQETIITHLLNETRRITEYNVKKTDHCVLHRWKYANNVLRDVQPVFLDEQLQLAACGDWSEGGRVEGAFTSAHTLVEAIKARIL